MFAARVPAPPSRSRFRVKSTGEGGPCLALPIGGGIPASWRRGPRPIAMTSTSILWSIRKNGVASRAILDRSDVRRLVLAWYWDDALQGVEEFSDARDAMRRAEELRLIVALKRKPAGQGTAMVPSRRDD